MTQLSSHTRRGGIAEDTMDKSWMIGTLTEISAAVGTIDEVETIPEKLLEAVVRYSPWTQCCASIYDLSSGSLVTRYSEGFDPEVVATWGDRLAPESPTSSAINSGAPMIISDVTSDGPYAEWTAAHVGGYASSLYIPMRISDQEAAVLSVHRPKAHTFTELEVSLAGVVTSFAAIAFRNLVSRVRAVEAERTANEHLSELNELAKKQNASLIQISTVQDCLLQVQLRSAGLDVLCETVQGLLGMPTLLLDRFHQLITFAGLDASDAETIVDELLSADGGGHGRLVTPNSRPALVSCGERSLLVGCAVDGQGSVGWMIAVHPPDECAEMSVRILELGCLHVTLEC